MPPKTKRGKENTAPKKKEKLAKEEPVADDFDEMMEIEEELPPKKKPGRTSKNKKLVEVEENVPEPEAEVEAAPAPVARAEKEKAGDSSLQKRLAAMTAERDRAIKERDTYAKQFDELSRLRQSAQETLFDKFQKQATEVAKAQDDIIANQTALNDKLTAKVGELERALAAQKAATERAEDKAAAAEAPPTLDGKLDGKSSKELHNEVFKLRNTLKDKEERLTMLQKEYDLEVAQSRKLQNEKTRPSVPAAPAVPAAVSSEESAKDHASLSLYEDFVGLTILHVNIRKSDKSGKDIVFSCMQTIDDRSFGFKVRSWHSFDRQSNKWVKQLEFTPDDSLRNEKDKSFVKRLGPFAEGFIIPREQAPSAWDQLRSRMSRDGEFHDPEVVN